MYTKTIFYLCLFFLFACGPAKQPLETKDSKQEQLLPPAQNNQVVRTTMDFGAYSSRIKMLKLPIYNSCEQQQAHNNYQSLDDQVKNYAREGGWIWGKLADTPTYTAIIYLYPADVVLPIIQTTDKQGNKISELQFYTEYCGGDEAFWGTARVHIESDLSITLSDSTETFERDAQSEIIPETVKTTVRHRRFFIREDGKIIERK